MPTQPLVFSRISLVVRDMNASLAFYRRLGLAIEPANHPDWVQPTRARSSRTKCASSSIGVTTAIYEAHRRAPPAPPRLTLGEFLDPADDLREDDTDRFDDAALRWLLHTGASSSEDR